MAARPHAVCLPMATQGHINPFLKLAKILHSKGFFITFVYTEFDYARLMKAGGPDAVKGSGDFRFETIPDGLPPSDLDGNRHIPTLCDSLTKNGLVPFRDLIIRLNSTASAPPVSLVIWGGLMCFGRKAAAELGISDIMFWTASASGLMGLLHYPQLIGKGLAPLKDESYLTNGFLDTPVDWIPGMRDIRLRDLPALFRTTDPDDILFNFVIRETQDAFKATAIMINTFEDLEHEVLDALGRMLPPIYTVGSISMLCKQMSNNSSMSLPSNLWKEDASCIEWLDRRDPKSVVYVNFGSIINLSMERLLEFAWGLANSNHFFLWVIRSDLVSGAKAILPQDFLRETKERCLVASWCPQEEVLLHPSVGAFLTHCGWNSTLESICGGVPVLCYPAFAEQTTNCYFACKKWGIGLEIGADVKRDEVEGVIKEVMDGAKAKDMRKKAGKLKEMAERAVKEGGTSYSNMNLLLNSLFSGLQ
ncbi:7-deoxyloganetin glucosyltransferase-like isoform X3 [Phoenix dactylifera]|uniref:Glycosyltransferase n=1 Tax=Phoenix dactylifera TaxID=42345 RepID=A0A8B9AHI9_PHODC|nr:7-deoxyloganetin glucosyltransferase-like isoform X3 [Phoenix dactylifera]